MVHEIEAPDDAVYTKVGKLAPSRAATLVREPGAMVAWGGCACDGYCGYDWLSEGQVQKLSTAGNPRIKHAMNTLRSALTEYRDEAGRPLILAEGGVLWGGLLADRPRMA